VATPGAGGALALAFEVAPASVTVVRAVALPEAAGAAAPAAADAR
jgi:hypothetical protein